jgi:hypothetical protein
MEIDINEQSLIEYATNHIYAFTEELIHKKQYEIIRWLYEKIKTKQQHIFIIACKNNLIELVKELYHIQKPKFKKFRRIKLHYIPYLNFDVLTFFCSSLEVFKFCIQIYHFHFTTQIVSKLLKYQIMFAKHIEIIHEMFINFQTMLNQKTLNECFEIACIHNKLTIAKMLYNKFHPIQLRSTCNKFLHIYNNDGSYNELINWLNEINLIPIA